MVSVRDVVGTDPPVEKTEDIEDWVFNLAADVAIRPVSRTGETC